MRKIIFSLDSAFAKNAAAKQAESEVKNIFHMPSVFQKILMMVVCGATNFFVHSQHVLITKSA
jgi:hypothetical protein